LSGGVTVWRVNDIRDLIARIGEQSNAESPAKRQRRGRKTTQEVS
jgi:hypothetical protein